jgi:hypothetical protein
MLTQRFMTKGKDVADEVEQQDCTSTPMGMDKTKIFAMWNGCPSTEMAARNSSPNATSEGSGEKIGLNIWSWDATWRSPVDGLPIAPWWEHLMST